MKDQILLLCVRYLKEGIDPETTLNKICSILIPQKEISNKFLRELIGFIFGINPEDLIMKHAGRRLNTIRIPRILYRKLLFDKYNNLSIVASKCNVDSHSSISNSLKEHRKLLKTNERYMHIFWAIETILTEAL